MKMPTRAALMSPKARKNRITRREYKMIFCFKVRAAACFFNRSSSRSTWEEDRNNSRKGLKQTCLLPSGTRPSDLQPVEDVFLLQLGLLLSQRAVVPAGERYHAVVAAAPASCRHDYPSCRSQPVSHSQSGLDLFPQPTSHTNPEFIPPKRTVPRCKWGKTRCRRQRWRCTPEGCCRRSSCPPPACFCRSHKTGKRAPRTPEDKQRLEVTKHPAGTEQEDNCPWDKKDDVTSCWRQLLTVPKRTSRT